MTLDFEFDDGLLRIDRHEPDYIVEKAKFILGNIDDGNSKSVAIYFDPLMCFRGTTINCLVTYKDYKDKLNSVLMEPREISVICPIIKTDNDISISTLKEFIEKLPSKDRRVYEIHCDFNMDNLILIAHEVIEKHNLRKILTLKTKNGRYCEIWYYGKNKVTGDNIVIKVSISAQNNFFEIFSATENAEALTGLLAEFGRDLKHSIELRISGSVNITCIVNRDHVIHRSKLLDFCSPDGTSPHVVLEGCANKQPNQTSGKVEIKDDKRAKKQREAHEKLLKNRKKGLS